MKTLVVLSALVAVALAAPTQPEKGLEDFKKIANVPETFKREKKSPQESSPDSAPGQPANLPSMPHTSEIGVSGRSFGFKKPIIIKKKPIGYQVYRDSDEAPAESGETCGSQVKVKFCDSKAKLKSSTIEESNSEMTKEEMKHSITLAKEAIENLQRDWNTAERKPGVQANSWNHRNSESDAELHQDIEVAREALEHIHKNFGNLESMSLHATTFKEEDVVPEASFTVAKTEEQRLAQWKEAIDAIQKNVEIAKNIEDSFRMTPDAETGSLISENTMIQNNKHELNKKLDHNLRTAQDIVTGSENKIESESCKAEHAHEKSNENGDTNDGLVEDDMASSASTISEKKMKDDQTRETSQFLTGTKVDQPLKTENVLGDIAKEKTAEVDTMVLKDLAQKNLLSDKVKSAENNKEEEETKKTGMKSVESEDMVIENQKKAAVSTETLENFETGQEKPLEMKSVTHFDEQPNKNKKEDKTQADLETEQSKQNTVFIKSAEETANIQQAEPNKQQNLAIDESEKHLAEARMANEDLKTQQELLASVNNDEQQLELQHQHHHSMFHPEMRATEDLKNMHQQLLMNPQTRWADNKNMQLQRESMMSANGIHSLTEQHPGHHHQVVHAMKNHHFEIPSSHGFHSRFPEQMMTQEKSADSDMQAYYMSMRDGSDLMAENQRFRWKPTHEAPRTAYGAPVAPAASAPASAIFPNANLGGCGIPLLLSCNPSVVSGNLAKPAPVPYSPPAYRTEDDFTFHTKRDAKKVHENLPSPLHRTKTNLQTSTVLVAKQ